jgi:hypothetical protein
MKPHLPPEVEALFPVAIVKHIESFVPHTPKPKKTPPTSPQLEKDLRRISSLAHTGKMWRWKKSEMYLRDLDDFMLD